MFRTRALRSGSRYPWQCIGDQACQRRTWLGGLSAHGCRQCRALVGTGHVCLSAAEPISAGVGLDATRRADACCCRCPSASHLARGRWLEALAHRSLVAAPTLRGCLALAVLASPPSSTAAFVRRASRPLRPHEYPPPTLANVTAEGHMKWAWVMGACVVPRKGVVAFPAGNCLHADFGRIARERPQWAVISTCGKHKCSEPHRSASMALCDFLNG